MAVWRLYRYRYPDGSSKDWAVTTLPDGRICTRWGKTAASLPGLSTRGSIRQFDIEKQKQAKGYVFVAEVDIDALGQLIFAAPTLPESPTQAHSTPPPIGVLYWHLECGSDLQVQAALLAHIQQSITTLASLTDFHIQTWSGWSRWMDLSLVLEGLSLSGQIQRENGVLPWLFLMAIKHQNFTGVDLGLATEAGAELCNDLKAAQDVLDFFGTDLDSIRPIAESLSLLKPRLNLAETLPDGRDCWF